MLACTLLPSPCQNRSRADPFLRCREVLFDDGALHRKSQMLSSLTNILFDRLLAGLFVFLVSKTFARLLTFSHSDSTEPARSPHAVWDEIGEAVIRELDYSHIILKLNT